MPTTVDIREAKAHLSSLIERAERGEEIVITEAGKPKVRLAPIAIDRSGRRPGRFAGALRVDAVFFESLPEEELAAWDGAPNRHG